MVCECANVRFGTDLCWSLQFFGCYFNLFRLMTKCGVLQNLLRKEHVHTFVNTGGDVRELDFRFFVGDKKIGAPFHGLKAFFTTPQLSVLDKVRIWTSCQQEDGLSYMHNLPWSSAAIIRTWICLLFSSLLRLRQVCHFDVPREPEGGILDVIVRNSIA